MTNQKNLNGDNVGGNKNTYYSNYPTANHSRLKELFKLLEEEQKENIQVQDIISDLERFTLPIVHEVKGLERKLEESGRFSIIEYALETKELYSKKLVLYTFFESAQKVNVYLLALVKSYYMRSIYPLVCDENVSESHINDMILDKIINPILGSLEGDCMGFTAEHIDGMIYYLTGNCHIKWTA
jgi:hypothetical protein